jgi:hypothetical protein
LKKALKCFLISSDLLIGHTFVFNTFVVKTFRSFLKSSHSDNKWSIVWSWLPHVHFGVSFIIVVNLAVWLHMLSGPCFMSAAMFGTWLYFIYCVNFNWQCLRRVWGKCVKPEQIKKGEPGKNCAWRRFIICELILFVRFIKHCVIKGNTWVRYVVRKGEIKIFIFWLEIRKY